MKRQRTRTPRLTPVDPETVALKAYSGILRRCYCRHGVSRGRATFCGTLASAGCVVCAGALCQACARWRDGIPLCKGCNESCDVQAGAFPALRDALQPRVEA